MRTHVVVLVALLFAVLAPAVDHHSAEHEPWHGHMLFGGVAALSRAHAHGYLRTHKHPAADQSAGVAAQTPDEVVSVPASQGVSGFETGGVSVIGAGGMALLVPPLTSAALLPQAVLPVAALTRTPDPPPQF
jgi:hypothetical protein